jgi:hypothetical protein
MAEHSLIAAYRADLEDRLPPDLADEILDGLAEAHEVYLSLGMAPDQAACAAITDLGDPRTIADAFRRADPARQLARILMVTGPAVGGCWAAMLTTGRAWNWPLPAAIPLLLGLTLAASISLLAISAITQRYDAARRAGTAGSVGVALLDASVILTTAIFAASASPWLFAAATGASLTRLSLIVRTLRPHVS